MTEAAIKNIRKVVEYMVRESDQGALDFCEFCVDPANDNTRGWAEAQMWAFEYLDMLGLSADEKRQWLLDNMQKEREKRQ